MTTSFSDECLEVDAIGLHCPMPLLMAKRALNGVRVGQLVKVMSTDQGSKHDFEVFAEQSGHQLVEFFEADGVYTHILRKC